MNRTKLKYTLTLLIVVQLSFAQSSMIWSTYYGGPGMDVRPRVATDNAGNVVLCGYTASSVNISSAGFQNSFGGNYDGFLVKFDAAGNRLWATYYGDAGYDYITGVTTDNANNIYVVGSTSSTAGISSSGFQNTYGGGNSDALIIKFDPAGNRLWASYYGGDMNESADGITVDASGNIYVAGSTSSSVGISSGGFQNIYGGSIDAFLVKFNSSGMRQWATYYGSADPDDGVGCMVDGIGNIYMCGTTKSTTGIASGGFKNTYSGNKSDAYLAKFDASGNRLWGTYYGGDSTDFGMCLISASPGNIYLGGFTRSISGIAFNGFQNSFAGGPAEGDAFLVKFDAAGNRSWATYYGGTADDYCLSVAKDAWGNVFMGGDTYSSSGIASGGFQINHQGVENEFLVKLDSNGIRLCATYFGVYHDEDGVIAVGPGGYVYLVGATSSTAGIASGGFQNTFGGGGVDAYLVKFSALCINENPVDVYEQDRSGRISVYPNPAGPSFKILVDNKIENGELILITSIGKEILRKEIRQGPNEVNVSEFSSGLYFYNVIEKGRVIRIGRIVRE